jgi:hypothetical protein
MVSLLLSFGGLDSSGFLLFLELLFTDLLLLHLVDRFNKNGLILIEVTLGADVEVMIDILGDLLSLSILLEKSSEYSLTSHPDDFLRHTGAGSTLSLTETVVSTLPLCLSHSSNAGSRVDMHLSLHDKTISVKLSNVLLELARATSLHSLGSIQTRL